MADKKFRYSKSPVDPDIQRLQRETEDNFISKDKDGNIRIDKDIHCRSMYVEGESLYIGGIKIKSPIHSEHDGFWKYDRINKEFAVSTDVLPSIDEDDMASDSADHVPTQQSVKKYVDDNAGSGTGDAAFSFFVGAMD